MRDDPGRDPDAPGGEFELIRALRERAARAGAPEASTALRLGSGDDAAILSPAGEVAISVDAVVEGVHFRCPPFDLRSVGHKALAAALSDLAAMGVAAGEAFVQLGLPPDLDPERRLELADGLGGLAAEHGVAIVGGDVSRSPVLFCAVTVVGHAGGAPVLTRAGARSGDVLAVTGELGGAAAGLILLERPELEELAGAEEAAALRARQLRPRPRLAAGETLAASGASAAIDLSDGLGGDAGHLAEASGVALRVDAERLPLQAGVEAIAAAAGLDPLELAAGGGEDYELLVALPPEALTEARARLAAEGTALSAIGEVADGAGVRIAGAGGSVLEPRGFDQLRAPSGRRGRA